MAMGAVTIMDSLVHCIGAAHPVGDYRNNMRPMKYVLLANALLIIAGSAFVSYWLVTTGHPWMGFFLFLLTGTVSIKTKKRKKKDNDDL